MPGMPPVTKRAPTPEEMRSDAAKLRALCGCNLDSSPCGAEQECRIGRFAAEKLEAAADALAERDRGCSFFLDAAQYATLLNILDNAPPPSDELRKLLTSKAPWALPSPPPAKEGEKT